MHVKRIDTGAVATSSRARLDFLTDFIAFRDEDWELLRDSVRLIAPRLPALLDGLYDHLLSYDDTRRLFLGSDGEVDPAYIAIRKEHLTEWFLETADALSARDRFSNYLMKIGHMHTAHHGESRRSVPPRYIVALMACIQAWLTDAILDAIPSVADARRFVIAWNKMLMIQLEMFLKAMQPAWDESHCE